MNTSEGQPESTLRATSTASRRPRIQSAVWRRLLVGLVAVFLFLLIVDLAVAWYYSDVLADEGLRIIDDEINYDLTAAPAGDGLVRLEGDPDDDRLNRPATGVWPGTAASGKSAPWSTRETGSSRGG